MAWNERRDEARARGPETPAHRPRKDRRRWCRGKPGVEHEPAVRLGSYGVSLERASKPWVGCHWAISYCAGRVPRLRWSCLHQIGCRNCGKALEWVVEFERCPQRHPRPVDDVLELPCHHCGRALREHEQPPDDRYFSARRCPVPEVVAPPRFWWSDPLRGRFVEEG